MNLGKGRKQGLDNTTITLETEYYISFSDHKNKFCLNLHYNGGISFLFVDGVKIYQFEAKYSETNSYPLYLGNVLVMFQKIWQLII